MYGEKLALNRLQKKYRPLGPYQRTLWGNRRTDFEKIGIFAQKVWTARSHLKKNSNVRDFLALIDTVHVVVLPVDLESTAVNL